MEMVPVSFLLQVMATMDRMSQSWERRFQMLLEHQAQCAERREATLYGVIFALLERERAGREAPAQVDPLAAIRLGSEIVLANRAAALAEAQVAASRPMDPLTLLRGVNALNKEARAPVSAPDGGSPSGTAQAPSGPTTILIGDRYLTVEQAALEYARMTASQPPVETTVAAPALVPVEPPSADPAPPVVAPSPATDTAPSASTMMLVGGRYLTVEQAALEYARAAVHLAPAETTVAAPAVALASADAAPPIIAPSPTTAPAVDLGAEPVESPSAPADVPASATAPTTSDAIVPSCEDTSRPAVSAAVPGPPPVGGPPPVMADARSPIGPPPPAPVASLDADDLLARVRGSPALAARLAERLERRGGDAVTLAWLRAQACAPAPPA
jgi:hypothetical protein